MSYIPKYIVKRMVPNDAVKATPDGIEIQFVNVISPIGIETFPEGDLLGFLEVKMDGKALSDDEKKLIKINFQNKIITVDNIRTMAGTTIAVGEKLGIQLPFKASPGEEHEIDVLIKLDHPFNLQVKRTIA